MNSDEIKYLDLISNIANYGKVREDRTGVGTKGVFGTQLRFSLENDVIPMITTKKMFTKAVIEELLFFIRGETDTKKLEAKGVNIWKGNTSREFLDKRGLIRLPEGDMGKGYGFQWRAFNCSASSRDESGPIMDHGVDQLEDVFSSLIRDPYSRRHIVTAWNPSQLHKMALPPCHMMFQFYVDDGELSLQWYQRSVDCFLGLPFNILSYSILCRIMAKATGLKAKEVIFVGGDTHLYLNHLEQVKTQTSREPFPFPTLKINKEITSVEDMEELQFSDFEIVDYQCHPGIKAEMAV